jgi:drug/metabolite transporter (DMT)-like permease
MQDSYICVLITNIFSSLYSTYINFARQQTGLDAMGILYYNYLVLFPIVAVLCATYELDTIRELLSIQDAGFQLSFVASVVLSVGVNIFGFYCTVLNSARTKTVTSCLKTTFTMTLGVYLFGDYVYSPANLLGVCVAFAGSVWYSYISFGRSSTGKGTATSKPVPVPTLPVQWSGK